jgi:pyruvate dehydrogenase E2 component (dihydrolipoamide acetyltransferase)
LSRQHEDCSVVSHEFRMPSLGADMEDGTLIEWRIKAGDAIHRGDIVALVETTKGIIDIESFEDAVVEQLLAPIGRQIPVGVPLAIFSGEATAAPAGPLPPPGKLDMPAAQARTERDHSRRAKVSPAARARAATSGVDAFAIAGSGPGGAVTLQDVETAAKKPSGAMRSAIGAALGRSKREIPHYYLQHSIDFGAARGWLDSYNAVRPAPERILPVALMIRAVALAAAQMPQFNGYYQLNAYAAVAAINVGVAIALRGEGLVAPAILDANRKSAAIIMTELQQLVARVRRGHMRSGELSAGTITLTSLGAANHLPATGGNCRLWFSSRPPLGGRRPAGSTACASHQPRRRSSGERWPPRCPVYRAHR